MRILYSQDLDLFYAKCTFEQRLVFKRRGWQWRLDIKKWTTKDLKKAREFYDIAEPCAKDILDQESKARIQEIEASFATESDIEVPAPPGLTPRGYQKAFVEFATKHKDVLLADPPGLGKTPQAILVSNYETTIRRVLVICPASLKTNWAREFERWTTTGLKPCIPEIKTRTRTKKGKVVEKWKEVIFPTDMNVFILNPEMLEKFRDEIRQWTWDQLIVDECHGFKNPQAKRTQELFGRRANKKKRLCKVDPIPAKRRHFLTGTPMLSRPVELWTLAKACDPDDLGKDYLKFITRYCDAYKAPFGWVAQGRSNTDELAHKLRKFMIRRNKEEVLPELPSKTRQIIELPREPFKSFLTIEENMVTQGLEEYERILAGQTPEDAQDDMGRTEYTVQELVDFIVEHGPRLSAVSEDSDSLKGELALAFEEYTLARQELALAKVPYAIEHIKSLLECEEKVIVFAVHTPVVEALREAFPDAACIYGKTPNKKRQAEVDRFQNDPDCRVFIGNIAAAGVGHTLTASSIVVFVELAWTPGEIEQAEDRAWRIGQDNAVLIYYLMVEGSLDTHLIRTFIDKMKATQEILDNPIGTR